MLLCQAAGEKERVGQGMDAEDPACPEISRFFSIGKMRAADAAPSAAQSLAILEHSTAEEQRLLNEYGRG